MSSSKPGPGESLAEKRPDIAAEWNQEKNGVLTPYDIKPGSQKRVWWQCSKGHEWQATVGNRIKWSNCPYCTNHVSIGVIEGYNDLATTNPEISKEWHPSLNGNLKPTDIRPNDTRDIYWICKNNHTYKSKPNQRTHGRGCTYCSNQKILVGYNDLATINPYLASEWHPTKNGELKPTDISAGSHKKVWWKCSKGHEWQATIASRSQGRGCPYCKSPGTSYGEQYIYWALKQIYPNTKNRFKTTNNVEYDIIIPEIRLAIEYSGDYWHEGKEERDQYKRELAEENGFQFIDIIEDWDCELNIIKKQNYFEYNPRKNQYKSLQNIISMILSEYEHSVSEIDFEIVKQNADLYSKRRKIEYEKSLEYLYPDLAKEWHVTKNNELLPSEVTPGSNAEVYWICSNGHEWKASPHSRKRGVGCPYCNGNHTVLVGQNDLATTNPELADQWHPIKNGNLKPTDIRAGSNKNVWWLCSKGHEWQATVLSRTYGNDCPYCTNKKVLCGYNDLATTHPQLVDEWHPTKNNEIKPTDIVYGSHKKVWWRCTKGHEWCSMVYTRSVLRYGCPECYNQRRRKKKSIPEFEL